MFVQGAPRGEGGGVSNYCFWLLGAKGIFAGFFFIAFLNSPCYETPKNAIEKKSNQTTEGEKTTKQKTDEKKGHIFCDEPRWNFVEKSFFRVFELLLLRNAQKRVSKKNRASNYLFFSAAANVRHFRHFFSHAPPPWFVCNTLGVMLVAKGENQPALVL
jgi:hypothetical protein